MFFGTFEYLLDDKNRLVVPKKFRESLTKKLYVLKGFDGCLSVYLEGDFQNYMSKLEKLPFEDKMARDVLRIALASVIEVEVDKASRIQIPTQVIKSYGITKEVTVVGVIDHFEIWSKDKWQDYKLDNERRFEEKQQDLLDKYHG